MPLMSCYEIYYENCKRLNFYELPAMDIHQNPQLICKYLWSANPGFAHVRSFDSIFPAQRTWRENSHVPDVPGESVKLVKMAFWGRNGEKYMFSQ